MCVCVWLGMFPGFNSSMYSKLCQCCHLASLGTVAEKMRVGPHVSAAAQITTCRGVVSGRLRSQQRQLEVELMRFCFRKLGALPQISCFTNLLRLSRLDKPGANVRIWRSQRAVITRSACTHM